MSKESTKYMQMAIKEAEKSGSDIPVGAIIVKNNQIIASTYNLKEQNNDPTAHAEILAIQQACEKLGTYRLDDTSLYVTLEPCPMCASAILYSRISKVYFGAYDSLYGAFGSAIDMTEIIKYKSAVIGGIEEEKCSQLLKQFFEKLRNEKL